MRSVELHGFVQGGHFVVHKSDPVGRVLGRGVQHKRVQNEDVSRFRGQFPKIFALVNKASPPTGMGQTFGMGEQVFADRRYRVGREEGAAASRLDVTPDHQAEQRLFGAVEEVAKKPAVLVPAWRCGGRPFPHLMGAFIDVKVEAVVEMAGTLVDLGFPAQQFADGVPGHRGRVAHGNGTCPL